MSRLKSNQYGGVRAQGLKARRDVRHKVCKREVDVLLRGGLEGLYFGPDNASIVLVCAQAGKP